MNERILELAKQAGLKFPSETAMSPVELKFAELIVQECASLMNAEKEYYSKPGTYESLEVYDRMATKENAFEDAASIIKSRFGVEE
jgi:hypothetical protein